MTFVVRRAQAEDVTALVDLLADVAAEDRWILTKAPVDRTRRAEAFARTLANASMACFVAVESDGRIAGQITFGYWSEGEPIRFGMIVRHDVRGAGVGSALLTAGLAWCRKRGEPVVQLEVYPHNEAALALYRKFGFVEVERRVAVDQRASGEWWDTIVMHRSLAQESDAHPPP